MPFRQNITGKKIVDRIVETQISLEILGNILLKYNKFCEDEEYKCNDLK